MFSLIVVWICLVFAIIWYYYVKKNIKTWDKPRLVLRNSVSLQDAVKMYKMVEELFRIVRIISWGIFLAVVIGVYMIFTESNQFWIEFTLGILPAPFLVHFIYKTVCLLRERAEELEKKSESCTKNK